MLGEQIFVEKRKISKSKGGSHPSTTVHSPENSTVKNSRLTFKFDGVFASKNKDSQQHFSNGNNGQNTLIIGDFSEGGPMMPG